MALLRNFGWLMCFAVTVLTVICWVTCVQFEPSWLQGFAGNLVGEIVGGLAFLFLGLHLSQRVERLTEETHALVNADIERRNLAERERLLLDQFNRFLQHENWHDARFQTLKTETHPLGLDYTIEPVRDELGEPRVHRTEMHTSYLIRVREPAQRKYADPADLVDYESAPIHSGEYYLARFYNGTWNMGQETIGDDWLPFYLSGKLGEPEWGRSANELVDGFTEPPAGSRLLRQMIVDEHGHVADAGSLVSIYRDDSGGVWVKPSHSSPPKQAYAQLDLADAFACPKRAVVVEDLEGYFHGDARSRFLALVESTVTDAGFSLPEVPRY